MGSNDNSNKKPFMIAVAVVCLLLAGVIAYMTLHKSSGLDEIKSGEMVWLMCNNPDCKNTFQIDKKDYFKFLQKNFNPMVTSNPGYLCPKCKENSAFRAEKCEKCGLIFLQNSVHNSFADTCPGCKYSKTAEERKKAAEARK